MDLKSKIRTIPHFPKQGVMFKDITPLLQDPEAFCHVIKRLAKEYKDKNVDIVASAESRGFIFGAALANEMKLSFVPLRKPGKLPYKTIRQEYVTEYSTDGFEIHVDAIKKGDCVLIIDDLLATGGTSKAMVNLVERLGGKVVGIAFLIELGFLKGREMLKGYDVFSLVNYESE
ncbi:adenine phosphoribosyltransferase [Candidatus Woesearchaeota archaeon]|nr:adenine phosphoribosyltransferase [Candidatus Woesearchaeota archaeon]